ncbi:MAG: hypothetical protein M1828_003203 [Chrysothrix sp. TS-e1954]|nr:MAG: hypothetical protein M1828_003203 [Chrysothrix sp. TS-e1954]
MSHRGYDAVVDVDDDVEGDLGHTDLQEDNLEFHSSNFADTNASKPSGLPPPSTHKSTHSTSSFSLPSASQKKHLLSLPYYAQNFDVDTNEVLRRCLSALFPRSNFLDVLDGNPDLYGPFWIATTVVVILFLTGSLQRWMVMTGRGDGGYDFALLGGASGLVYGYTSVVPLGLWAVLKWSGSEAAELRELWCLYGYANLIWVPVAIISWSAFDILNYIFSAIGFLLSTTFLLRNLYPIISTTARQRHRFLLIAVVVLHAGLAIAIKILFFAQTSVANKGKGSGGANNAPSKGEDDAEEGAMMVRRLLRL